MEANGGNGSNTLEKYGWGEAAAVEKWLFAEGYQFDFFQAVRLLEMIHAATDSQSEYQDINAPHHQFERQRARVSPAEGADPSKELVRFSSAVSLDFPASDIAEVNSGNGATGATAMVDHFKKRETPAGMTVNFLGLAGSLGTLDIPTTELVLQRVSRSDEALKDFLDIFNHRLVSLLYKIRKHHRVGVDVAAPGEDQISKYLYSMIGLGTPNLKGRMHVRDRALLYYSGILAHQTRSIAGLERLLEDYFQVKVKGRQFVGQWCDLEDCQCTRIGDSGQNQRLGEDVVLLGTRVWDQQARFEIQLGPLTLEQFVSFLPTGWQFAALSDLIRFYVRNELDFDIRLVLKADEIPSAPRRISEPELSWTSWLGSSETAGGNDVKPAKQEDPYITICPKSVRADDISINSVVLYRLPRGKQSELLAEMDDPRSVPRNTVVMQQGGLAKAMYLIRRGAVQISRRDERGKETVVRLLGQGDSFGESALLAGKPYSNTALTLSECELITIDGERLAAFVARYPDLQRTIDAYTNRGKSSATQLEKVRR